MDDVSARMDEAMAALDRDVQELKDNYAKLLETIGPITENRVAITLDDDGSVKQVVFQPGTKDFMTGAEINGAIMIGLTRSLEAAVSASASSHLTDEDRQRILNDIRWRRGRGTPYSNEPFTSWDGNVEVRAAAGRIIAITCNEDWLKFAREKTISDTIADVTKKALSRNEK